MCAVRRIRRFEQGEGGREGARLGEKASLSQQAYRALKHRILFGEYVPGRFLQETIVCADLKLGRTPVRHALQRLEQEGFLEIIPARGSS